MSPVRRTVAVAGILATAGFGSFAAASVASATTHQCAKNDYCWSQEVTGTKLVMSAEKQRGYNGEPVVVHTQSSKDPTTDFLDGLAPFPKTSNAKFFEYAPYGKQSGLCVSEPKSHASLVLKKCDGSLNQTWDAGSADGSFEWQNEATSDFMTDGKSPSNTPGGKGTQLTGQHTGGKKNQLWTRTQS